MRRLTACLLASLAIGCGKSFTEADAIYKDEVAKMEALKDQYEEEVVDLSRNADHRSQEAQDAITAELSNWKNDHPHYGGYEWNAAVEAAVRKWLDVKYEPLLSEQKKKVDAAFAEKEAAK